MSYFLQHRTVIVSKLTLLYHECAQKAQFLEMRIAEADFLARIQTLIRKVLYEGLQQGMPLKSSRNHHKVITGKLTISNVEMIDC